MKIGLFGGSFDPVHFGHLLIARAAREELGLDKVIFIPAAQSPFKSNTVPAPAAQRLRLLRLALAGDTASEIDDLEIKRVGMSYTVETLRHYAKKFPGAQLFYLIGTDQAAHLAEWREPEELARLADFVVAPRPGEPPAALPAQFHGHVLRGFPATVASSELRERIKAGLPITHLTPAAVAEAISINHLYL